MEDVISEYMKTLPPKKVQQFIQYFQGWNLAMQDNQEGLYIAEDSKISNRDKQRLQRYLFLHARNHTSAEKLTNNLTNF